MNTPRNPTPGAQPVPQPTLPFVRTDHFAMHHLVGVRWWQERLSASSDPMARRAALIALGATAVVVAGVGVAVAVSGSSSGDVAKVEQKSLEAQRELGWNVGAGTADLTFDGATGEPFNADAFDRMQDDLAPADGTLLPFYVPTLFQSLTALPSAAPIETDPMKRLRDTVRPVRTAAMKSAEDQGAGLASLFEGAPAGRAVIVDLPGPEAVAFAAGLASRLDPVFAFDGWPHPQGVVPSHLTLAAAAGYQGALSAAKSARKAPAPAAFILDRGRLLPYVSDSDRFDNRYTAKLPTAENLKSLGVKQIMYVSRGGEIEADDLNDDFVAYEKAGIEIRRLDPDDFQPSGSEPVAFATAAGANAGATADAGAAATYATGRRHYWGGSSGYHWFFWSHYGWGTPRYPMTRPISGGFLRPSYHPATRSTFFSGRSRPSGFGSVGLYRSTSSGRPVGTSRSGSWGRSSTGSGSTS